MTRTKPRLRQDILALLGFIGVSLFVSVLGGVITSTSVGNWYQTLEKPSFNSPDWLFAPVWTSLFLMMAIAGWRVWRRAGFGQAKKELTLYGLQLGLNLAWSTLFFGFQNIGLALAEIILLLIAIIANTILFWRIDRPAGILFVPYVLWVGFASILNASLWLLN